MIPADGVLISSEGIEIDESAMTGENEKRRKASVAECIKARDKYLSEHPSFTLPDDESLTHEISSPICLSGTTLVEGRGRMLVLAVGRLSAVGFILDSAQESPGQTPLEEKLEKIANFISKIGLICGSAAVILLIFKLIIEIATGVSDLDVDVANDILKFFIIGILSLIHI